MSDQKPSRRNAMYVMLILAAICGMLAFGWAFKAAFVAFGLLVRMFAGVVGLLFLIVFGYWAFRSFFSK